MGWGEGWRARRRARSRPEGPAPEMMMWLIGIADCLFSLVLVVVLVVSSFPSMLTLSSSSVVSLEWGCYPFGNRVGAIGVEHGKNSFCARGDGQEDMNTKRWKFQSPGAAVWRHNPEGDDKTFQHFLAGRAIYGCSI